jgi:putative transposase
VSQSLSKILVHIVFSTKNHAPMLSQKMHSELFGYIAGILKNLDSKAIIINGTQDHIHILCQLSKNHSPSEIVQKIKSNSSKWAKSKSPNLADFQWQNGYGVFSVSESNLNAVKTYIQTQQQHHKKLSFQEEFKKLLDKHNIEYDNEHLWN